MAIKNGDIVTYLYKKGFFKIGKIVTYTAHTYSDGIQRMKVEMIQIAKEDGTPVKKATPINFVCIPEDQGNKGNIMYLVTADRMSQLIITKQNEVNAECEKLTAIKNMIK